MITALLVGIFGMLGALLRFAVDSFFAGRPAASAPAQPAQPVESTQPGDPVQSWQRYPLRSQDTKTDRRHWPWATLVVNVTGCFIIGLVMGVTAELPAGEWQTGLAAGLAGGLTTFSSWTTATVRLLTESRPAAAAGNIAGNLALGLAAAAAGAALTL